MHIIIICKIILMIMVGDVHIDLCKPSSRGSGKLNISTIINMYNDKYYTMRRPLQITRLYRDTNTFSPYNTEMFS